MYSKVTWCFAWENQDSLKKIGNQCNGCNASTMCAEYLLLFRTLAAEF